MAELVDALDSKSSDSNIVWVRFPLRVQKKAEVTVNILLAVIFLLQVSFQLEYRKQKNVIGKIKSRLIFIQFSSKNC
jgi:hypothetical protein